MSEDIFDPGIVSFPLPVNTKVHMSRLVIIIDYFFVSTREGFRTHAGREFSLQVAGFLVHATTPGLCVSVKILLLIVNLL